MPRPAHELLNPASPVKPAWAVFDAPWYLRHYADALAMCAGWVGRILDGPYISIEGTNGPGRKFVSHGLVWIGWNNKSLGITRHRRLQNRRSSYLY